MSNLHSYSLLLVLIEFIFDPTHSLIEIRSDGDTIPRGVLEYESLVFRAVKRSEGKSISRLFRLEFPEGEDPQLIKIEKSPGDAFTYCRPMVVL